MTLQNLSKLLDKYESQLGSTEAKQFELLHGLPFYNWRYVKSFTEVGDKGSKLLEPLDFNRAIGLPQKNGQSMPLFDYEQLLYGTLQRHKHVWIKKATGLGVTELMLRFMAWFCLKDNSLKGSQMCIVTGPRIELG